MHQYIDSDIAAREFCLSKQSIIRIFAEIEKVKARYGDYAFRGEGKTRQVRYAVIDDYMRWRKWFKEPDAARYVPPFDVRQAERELGVLPDIKQEVDIEDITKKVLQQLSILIAEKS